MSATPELPVSEPPLPECSCSSTAVTSVFVTLLIVLIIEAGLYVLWKIYWRGKKGQHLVLVTDSEKGDLYAYDNPGFKEGPSLVPAVEKENNNKAKWALWAGGLVPNGNMRIKAMDDSFTKSPVVRVVPLRSRDFTGLGFNICGNMRDGVFIKDVLHRGPASESGHIQPGDRLESVKVCLRHVVLEDALTILSYASPYEVELEVSTASTPATAAKHPPAPRSIAHPFYKSRSISDLHQIEKSNSSSSRKSGEKRGSPLDDVLGESKLSTLEKRSKQEAERYQNTKNCIIESVQRQEFHTIELDEPDRKETSSPSNVKAMIAKGIQNLKEKLHNSLHQDEDKGSSGSGSRTSTLDKKRSTLKDEGFRSVELSVPEEDKGKLTVSFSGGEKEEVERKRKGKAPTPPQVEVGSMEISGVVELSEGVDVTSIDVGSCESMVEDSDGETVQGGRIELDSSHVTVHQADGGAEGRKASSLGDLSRYEADRLTVLERAVSLDLADGGRKRKAPQPPQELAPTYKEVEPPPTGGTLKKSNVWGTLEDALRNSESEEEHNSGRSTPDVPSTVLVTSTPFSVREPLTSMTTFGVRMAEPIDSEIHIDDDLITKIQEKVTPTVNGNNSSGGSTPLPISPEPDFITEIQILTDRLADTSESLQETFNSCRDTTSPSNSSQYDEDISSKPVINGTSPEMMNNDDRKHEGISLKSVLDAWDSKVLPSHSFSSSSLDEIDSPIRTVKSFGSSSDESESPKRISSPSYKNETILIKKKMFLDFPDESTGGILNSYLPEEEKRTFATFKTETKKIRDDGEINLNKILKGEVPEKRFSIVEIETEAPIEVRPAEVVKPPRNVSVTSIKTNTSRIPVRSGQKSPGSGKHSPELRRLADRNGHHSP